jgi:Spy/CpxP family protein refolding chaperone
MKKNAFMLSLAIFLCLGAGDIFSQPAEFGKGMGRGRGPMHRMDGPMWFGNLDEMKEVLKLTDKQIEQIGRINTEFRDAMIRLHERMRPLQLKLKGLLLGERINFDDIKSILKQISEVEVDMRMLKIKQRVEIENILTKDQRDKLKSERRTMMHNWR